MQPQISANDGRNSSPLSAGWPLPIANLKVDAASPIPIYEQICGALRSAIAEGDLPGGTLIPTSRDLAQALKVGRNTIVAAYTRLVAEGYLVSNTRRGTRVTSSPFGNLALGNVAADEPRENPQGPNLPMLQIGYHARHVLELPLRRGAANRPFALNTPDPSLYPRNQLSRLLAEEFRRPVGGDVAGDIRRGNHIFQTAIATYLRHMRGVACSPEQVLPVGGFACALDLAARVLLDPGHNVYMETPSLDIAHAAFCAAGAQIHALPAGGTMDGSQPPPRLIFVSPNLAHPTGTQMPEAQRLALVKSARDSGAVIMEWDAYGDLLYTSARLPSLHALDRGRQVIYFGSLSETLGPHIQMGYLIVPPSLVDAVVEMMQRVASWPDSFVLSAVGRFLDERHYAMHARNLRSAYSERMRLTVQACREHLSGVTVLEPAGGFHIAVLFDRPLDESLIERTAFDDGLCVTPLGRFHPATAGKSGIVLGFSNLPDRLIDPSVRRLAAVIDRVRNHRLGRVA